MSRARSFSCQTADLDEARSVCDNYYYPVTVDLLSGKADLAFSLNVIQVGPITIGDAQYGSDIRMTSDDLVTAYHVNVPLSGHLESRHRGLEVNAHPGRAAVYQPFGRTVLPRWGADCRQLCVKIDSAALESELEAALGRPVRAPLDFAPSLDTAQGAGHSWAQLVRLVAAGIRDPDAVVHQPLVGQHLCHSLLAGLLLAVEHRYRDELTRPAAPCLPRTVKRAVDAMEADPARPYQASELAKVAKVSVRALQEGFRRYAGMAPMAYLRQLRLARVHEELGRADPDQVTVADVAYRWGFAHLGRFAGAYRARYGVPPSHTLRSPR